MMFSYHRLAANTSGQNAVDNRRPLWCYLPLFGKAFQTWKLAKGLYIIPIVMAYHPLLLNGTTGEVVQTVIFCTVAITAFVICLERYFLVPLIWVETILYGGAAIALIWANDTVNYIGFAVFVVLSAYQIIAKRKAPNPKTGSWKPETPWN